MTWFFKMVFFIRDNYSFSRQLDLHTAVLFILFSTPQFFTTDFFCMKYVGWKQTHKIYV